MIALVYDGDHNIALEERPKPTIIKPTNVIIKVTKTTIFGTDLGNYKGKNPEVESGRILGHKGIGIIEDVGDSVTRFNKWDKVLISCITSWWVRLKMKKNGY